VCVRECKGTSTDSGDEVEHKGQEEDCIYNCAHAPPVLVNSLFLFFGPSSAESTLKPLNWPNE
jgi:NADH:ubiquinone oxidoreductase subunit E